MGNPAHDLRLSLSIASAARGSDLPGLTTVRAFGTFIRAPALDSAMQYVLILLVAVTLVFGAAASVTVSLASAYADDSGKGY